jgi:hypothetical protein
MTIRRSLPPTVPVALQRWFIYHERTCTNVTRTATPRMSPRSARERDCHPQGPVPMPAALGGADELRRGHDTVRNGAQTLIVMAPVPAQHLAQHIELASLHTAQAISISAARAWSRASPAGTDIPLCRVIPAWSAAHGPPAVTVARSSTTSVNRPRWASDRRWRAAPLPKSNHRWRPAVTSASSPPAARTGLM